ncbi:MAG TPA: hypothetical protein VIT88_03840 [Pyrinomonadaceae bacterium]
MYCPRCGQQQVSDEMRFCSRCGLPIGGLIEWLGRAGMPAAPVTETQSSLPASPRRKGIRRGGKVMFVSAVLFVIFLIISLAVDEGGPMVIPFFVFFVGLVMMLYARLFSSPVPQIKSQITAPPGLGAASMNALPPRSHIPMHDVSQQRGRTNELAQPPSVTENTTRLLDND